MAQEKERQKLRIVGSGARRYLSSYGVVMLVVSVLAIVSAGALLFLETKFQLAMLMAIPASLVMVVIIRQPYVGVFLYYVYTFLRPPDFIPALGALKLGTLLALITFGGWLAHTLRFAAPIRWDRFNYYYLGFLVVVGSGAFFGINNFKPYKAWEVGFVAFLAFLSLINVTHRSKQIRLLLFALIGIHVYFALKGIYNYVFYVNQLGSHTTGEVGYGYIGDENDFAMALNVMIPLVFFSAMASMKKWVKFLAGAVIILFLVSLILSQSRGGFVGLVAVIGMIIWFSRKYLTGVVAAALVGIGILLFAPSGFVEELLNITDTQENTADARIRYWKAGLRMYADYPILGVGADNGGAHLPDYIRGVRSPGTQWGRVFHGLFPQLLAELGTIGTGLWMLMFISMMYQLNRIRMKKYQDPEGYQLRCWAAGLMVAMVGYVITSTFLSTAYYPQIWTLYALSFALIWLHRSYIGEEVALNSGIPLGRPQRDNQPKAQAAA